MISVDEKLLSVVRAAFPDAHVALGVGVTSMKADTVITVASNGVFPIGSKARAARWVVDVMVFSRSREEAFTTAGAVIETIGEAVDAGEVGHAVGWSVVTLPMSVDNPTSSQQHAVVSCALQVVGHYGT